MSNFKQRWEITKNWQLLWPIAGLIGLGYSAFKLANLFPVENLYIVLSISLTLFYVLLKLTLKLFKFLEKRWKVDHRWQVIRIFIIFAITGSMSVIVTEPIFKGIGFVKSNFVELPLGTTLFYILKFLLILPFYKVLLVFFGWVFGEYKFFLNFALKMASRFGFKRLVEKFDSK